MRAMRPARETTALLDIAVGDDCLCSAMTYNYLSYKNDANLSFFSFLLLSFEERGGSGL